MPTTTLNECFRIADQLRRAFEGKAWHGPALRELLTNITAEQASARPLASGHTIWELVLHIEVWTQATAEAIQGTPMPKIVGTDRDWPADTDRSATEWAGATDRLFQTGERLAKAIEGFTDERLDEIVPGRKYNFYYLFHGIVQHSLYHAGQIALLKKAK